jgi:hypothetical protein
MRARLPEFQARSSGPPLTRNHQRHSPSAIHFNSIDIAFSGIWFFLSYSQDVFEQRRMPAIRECLHWKSEPHPTLGDIPSKMVREAAQEAITAIFDTEKPLTNVSQAAAVGHSFSGPPPSLGPSPRYEGFGSSNSGGNFQGGLKGISGPNNFEEDRSILSYASAPQVAQYGNGGSSKMAGFGNSLPNASHGNFDKSKGIEVVKHVGAKAASILTAGASVRLD